MDPIKFEEAVLQYMRTNPNATRQQAEDAIRNNPDFSQDFSPEGDFAEDGGLNFNSDGGVGETYTPPSNSFLTDEDREAYRKVEDQWFAEQQLRARKQEEEFNEDELDALAEELAQEQDRQAAQQNRQDIQNGFNLGSSFGTPTGSATGYAANLGRYIGMDKGTKGRGLGIAANAGALIFDVARTVASNAGQANATRLTEEWERDQINKANRRFTPAPQSRDSNYLGGALYRYGGEHSILDTLQGLSRSIPQDSVDQNIDGYYEAYPNESDEYRNAVSMAPSSLTDQTFDSRQEAKDAYLGGQNIQTKEQGLFVADEDYDISNVDAEDTHKSDKTPQLRSMQTGGSFLDFSAYLDGYDTEPPINSGEKVDKRKTIANTPNPKYGTRNYLLERSNERRSNLDRQLAVADAEGARLTDDLATNTAYGGRITLGQSMKMAREINRRNKEEHPGVYGKVRSNAFVRKKAENEVVSFRKGGCKGKRRY